MKSPKIIEPEQLEQLLWDIQQKLDHIIETLNELQMIQTREGRE